MNGVSLMTKDDILKKPGVKINPPIEIKFIQTKRGQEIIMTTGIGSLIDAPGYQKATIVHQLLMSGKN